VPNLAFTLELKQLGEKGEFSGLASTYNNVDELGDVVEPGAFTKTLAGSKERPLLWNHRDPIGMVQLTDSPGGLLVQAKLSLAVRQAAEAYTLLKDNIVRGLSIGYETIRSDFVGPVRHLRELKLWEVSLVTLPANTQAVVTGVKTAQDAQIRAAWQEFRRDILRALGGK
jgi:HK97 family phage prohead protease